MNIFSKIYAIVLLLIGLILIGLSFIFGFSYFIRPNQLLTNFPMFFNSGENLLQTWIPLLSLLAGAILLSASQILYLESEQPERL